ncbi:cilia-and flagella-associated protein 43 [Trichonephila inaurata madagascariensis]|uniref:Cilia-and flagella-associated protein 43 n=1 Tax=Trichonephila inaurata madagascariensis TaxID=2747483 RepID=A0A8X7BXD4_9ARAC|nr:cilia-and flagella-associated protein 43 [Trichonephila inaurata madagascariensis]
MEPEHHPFEAESEPEDSEDSADKITEKSFAQDSIQTSKRSIESLSASAKSSENPFWKPNLTIAPEDILMEELAKKTAPPRNIDAPFWKNIYGKRIRYIKLGIILRHIQYQIMKLTKLILHCSEMKSKLEMKHWYRRRILENMKLLLTKLNENIYVLLTVNLENPEFTFNGDLSDRNDFIRFPDLNKLSPVRDKFWKVIRINVKKNQNLQRQLEVQESMKSFLNLRTELNSKLEKCKMKQKAYFDEVRKDLKDHTNAFSGNKIIIKDIIGDKWNILKVH